MPKESAKTTITAFSSTPLVRVVDGTLSRNISPANLVAESGLQTALDGRYVTADEVVCDDVITGETRASATFGDMATVGPTCVVTVPASGRVLVRIGAGMVNSSATETCLVGVALSGANTVAASDDTALGSAGTAFTQATYEFELTGLTAGVTTFTAKYRTTGGTGTIRRRRLTVVPLP